MHEDISRFEIAMYNAFFYDGRESGNQLVQNLKRLLFGKPLIHGVSFQIAILTEIEHQINGVRCSYGINQLDNIAMSELFHDSDFGAERLLEVGVSSDHALLDFLDSHATAGLVKALVYFTEWALAQTVSLAVLVFADFF